MKHEIEIAPNIAIIIDGERVIGSKPYGLFLTTVMTVSDDDLKRLADRCLEVISDRKTENSSEIPNNCEHITEDGVTCAKYPACDDCLDNPLNKVKGSKRLVKGSEQTEPTISKMEQVDKDINVRSKDEPTMRLHEWTSDDITFCTAKCEVKCFRKPKYIKHKDIPHSFSDFSNSCVEYEPKDEQSGKE